MSRGGTFLDIDPSIAERNLKITDSTFEDELKHIFPEQKEVPSKLIKPSPGFCIKTKSSDNAKVFINVCQSDALPAPRDISEDQLIEILESETPSEYRVPMSIGEPRKEKDKAGKEATAYDIVINPQFFTKIENSQIFKQFFVTVVFEGLQDKYQMTINVQDFAILKNKKAMGELQFHRIQQRVVDKTMNKEKKLIEEIDAPTKTKSKFGTKEEGCSKMPVYRLLEVERKVVLAEVYMPDVISVKDITLEVGEDRIVLEHSKKNTFLDIFIPRLIVQEQVKAALNKLQGILTITMPVVQTA